MRTTLQKLFSLGLLLPVVLACGLAGLVKKKVEQSQKPVTMTSADLKNQIIVPGGWREEKQLNEGAVLQAGNRLQEMYVVVIKESKQDFADGATLEDFAAASRTSMMSNIEIPEATEPIATQLGDHRAMEYRLDGTVDKIKVRYICTMVETPKYYYQIITWTLPSRFDRNQATLREVTQSFRELKSD